MCIILKTEKITIFEEKKNHNFQDICVKEVNGLWFSSLMHYIIHCDTKLDMQMWI